jgi:hypothetical protein
MKIDEGRIWSRKKKKMNAGQEVRCFSGVVWELQ